MLLSVEKQGSNSPAAVPPAPPCLPGATARCDSATLLLDTSAPRMGGKGDFYIIQYIVSGDAERKGGWKKQGAHEGLTQ